MKTRIYIAGGFLEKDLISSYMRRLEETGLFQITCDWTKAEAAKKPTFEVCNEVVEPGVSTCTRVHQHEGAHWASASDADLTDDEQKKFATADLCGVINAKVVWHIVAGYKGSRGAYVELGYALALSATGEGVHAPMYVIASGADVRKTIFHSLCASTFPEHEQAFEWLVAQARKGLLE